MCCHDSGKFRVTIGQALTTGRKISVVNYSPCSPMTRCPFLWKWKFRVTIGQALTTGQNDPWWFCSHALITSGLVKQNGNSEWPLGQALVRAWGCFLPHGQSDHLSSTDHWSKRPTVILFPLTFAVQNIYPQGNSADIKIVRNEHLAPVTLTLA